MMRLCTVAQAHCETTIPTLLKRMAMAHEHTKSALVAVVEQHCWVALLIECLNCCALQKIVFRTLGYPPVDATIQLPWKDALSSIYHSSQEHASTRAVYRLQDYVREWIHGPIFGVAHDIESKAQTD